MPFVVWMTPRNLTDERAAVMNPNYGYQLYQAERTQTRAEVLAGDDAARPLGGGFPARAPGPGAQEPGTRDHGHHRGPDGSRRMKLPEPARGGTA